MKFSLLAGLLAEFLGTAFLLAAVIGSGTMGERLAGGNVAFALLANTIATGAALLALISTFGAISGAHFNPAVMLAAGPPARDKLPRCMGEDAYASTNLHALTCRNPLCRAALDRSATILMFRDAARRKSTFRLECCPSHMGVSLWHAKDICR